MALEPRRHLAKVIADTFSSQPVIGDSASCHPFIYAARRDAKVLGEFFLRDQGAD